MKKFKVKFEIEANLTGEDVASIILSAFDDVEISGLKITEYE